MAISIDYSAYPFVINVPKADMLLVQSTPIEVRQLNMGDFHAELRDLEDDEVGICFPRTHTYQSPVSVGGVDLAYVISITDDYSITFENGAYAVNLVGGNSNIADRVNINNVGVRSANSAGLPDLDVLQRAAFGDVVTINSGSVYSGTTYPVGTQGYPVNNVPDAVAIAQTNNITTLKFASSYTLSTGDDVSNYKLLGVNANLTQLTINSAAVTNSCTIIDCFVTGNLDGGTLLERCVLQDLNYVNGFVYNCMLNPGTITLGGTTTAFFLGCYSGVPGVNTPVIDMNGTTNDQNTPLAFRDYSGGIKLIQKTGLGSVSMDFSSGQCVIDSTCVEGQIVVRGNAKCVDENGDNLYTGTINTSLDLVQESLDGRMVQAIWQELGLSPEVAGNPYFTLNDYLAFQK